MPFFRSKKAAKQEDFVLASSVEAAKTLDAADGTGLNGKYYGKIIKVIKHVQGQPELAAESPLPEVNLANTGADANDKDSPLSMVSPEASPKPEEVNLALGKSTFASQGLSGAYTGAGFGSGFSGGLVSSSGMIGGISSSNSFSNGLTGSSGFSSGFNSGFNSGLYGSGGYSNGLLGTTGLSTGLGSYGLSSYYGGSTGLGKYSSISGWGGYGGGYTSGLGYSGLNSSFSAGSYGLYSSPAVGGLYSSPGVGYSGFNSYVPGVGMDYTYSTPALQTFLPSYTYDPVSFGSGYALSQPMEFGSPTMVTVTDLTTKTSSHMVADLPASYWGHSYVVNETVACEETPAEVTASTEVIEVTETTEVSQEPIDGPTKLVPIPDGYHSTVEAHAPVEQEIIFERAALPDFTEDAVYGAAVVAQQDFSAPPNDEPVVVPAAVEEPASPVVVAPASPTTYPIWNPFKRTASGKDKESLQTAVAA